jgi:hypothetical protein
LLVGSDAGELEFSLLSLLLGGGGGGFEEAVGIEGRGALVFFEAETRRVNFRSEVRFL